MRENQIAGEFLGTSEAKVESYIERVRELVKDITRELSET